MYYFFESTSSNTNEVVTKVRNWCKPSFEKGCLTMEFADGTKIKTTECVSVTGSFYLNTPVTVRTENGTCYVLSPPSLMDFEKGRPALVEW